MVIKKGIENLKDYIINEEEECKKIDDKLTEIWSERTTTNLMEQAVLNRRKINLHILKDILQELETDDVKLKITFSGPMQSDLPSLARERFNEHGIKLESKGGVFRASVEAIQSEFVVFWIGGAIGIIAGSITIGNFIYEKLKNYKNTKIKIGTHEIDSSTSSEELQKIIQDELKRLRDEIDDFKNK